MAQSRRRLVLFETAEHLFAADVQHVREVVEPAAITPVPGAVPGVLGLMNVRGSLLVAADLAALLGLQGSADVDPVVLVLELDAHRIAVQVDAVVEMSAAPGDGLDVESDLLEALGARDLVSGVGKLGTRPYFRLALDALMEHVLADHGERSVEHASTGG